MAVGGRARVSSEVFAALARVVGTTGQDAARILRRDDLNPAQYQLLRAVSEWPGITQARLGQIRGVTPGGVSQLVVKVEVLGLLRREPAGAAYRLWLTDAGRELVDRLVPDQDAFFVERFAGLSDDELETLAQLLAKVEGRLHSPE